MRRMICSAAVVLVLAAPAGQGQSLVDHPRVRAALELLQAWLDAQRAYEQMPGLSMAVVHDQQLLWSGGYGYADPERGIPATGTTIYSICSISKLFTSIAVLQLRDQGRLRLDDPLEKHLAWLDIKKTYAAQGPATVGGILTHSSGLPRESDYPYWNAPDFPFPSPEQIREKLKEQETLYPADTYYQYSNLGLTLAGELVAELSHQRYTDYVAQHILVPLHLADTQPRMPEEQRGARLARGYSALTREGKREPLPFFQANGITPAAGFSSTVEDLGKFASWQFRLLEKGGEEILAANTLREMHRIHWIEPDWKTAYGLGFMVWGEGDKTFVGHGGSCPGYRSHLLIQPKDKIATVFMTNASGVDAKAYAAVAYAIVAPAILEALDSTKSPKTTNPLFRKYSGTYRDFPWGGETAVLLYEDGLAAVDFPTDDPVGGITRLKHVGGDRFRRVRKDGALGETVDFEVDAGGSVRRLKWHSVYQEKIR